MVIQSGVVFNPAILFEQPVRVLGVLSIVVLGNFIVSFILVIALRYPLNTALSVAVGLAQIGEFSIILAGLGSSLGLLPVDGMNLILAAVLISIALNSFLFSAIQPVRSLFLKHSKLARIIENRPDPYAELPMETERKYLEGQVVLVGFGRVGSRIAKVLSARGIPYVVAEQNRELVEELRRKGIVSVSGNAADPSVLIQSHIANAAMLVVATPDMLDIRHIADTARTLNPNIEILLRTHDEDESVLLRKEGIGTVFYGEEELAKGMAGYILGRFAPKERRSRARTADDDNSPSNH